MSRDTLNGTPAGQLTDFSESLATDLEEALGVLAQEVPTPGASPGGDLHSRLAHLLAWVRRLTRADGGSIYLREGDRLHLAVVQSQSLSRTLGLDELRRRLEGRILPVRSDSIAGHVALSGDVVNVPDARRIPPDRGYRFCPALDPETYEYRSLLTVPMEAEPGRVVGVLQLINASDDEGQPTPFGLETERIALRFAARAARLVAESFSEREAT